MFNFSKVSHGFTIAGSLFFGWAVSEQGQSIIGAIVHAYPKLTGLAAIIAFSATVYFNPKNAQGSNPGAVK